LGRRAERRGGMALLTAHS